LDPPKALRIGNPTVASVGTTPAVVEVPAKVPAPGSPARSITVNGILATEVLEADLRMRNLCAEAQAAIRPSLVVIAIT
jgi:hypothetical protein